jgi:hypothetical protein
MNDTGQDVSLVSGINSALESRDFVKAKTLTNRFYPYFKNTDPSSLFLHSSSALAGLKHSLSFSGKDASKTVTLSKAVDVLDRAVTTVSREQSFSTRKASFVGAVSRLQSLRNLNLLYTANLEVFEDLRAWWPDFDIFPSIEKFLDVKSSQLLFEGLVELTACFETARLAKEKRIKLASLASLESALLVFLEHYPVFDEAFDFKILFQTWYDSLGSFSGKSKLISLHERSLEASRNVVLVSCHDPSSCVRGLLDLTVVPWATRYTMLVPEPAVRYLRQVGPSQTHEVLPFNILNDPSTLQTAERLYEDKPGSLNAYIDIATRIG